MKAYEVLLQSDLASEEPFIFKKKKKHASNYIRKVLSSKTCGLSLLSHLMYESSTFSFKLRL